MSNLMDYFLVRTTVAGTEPVTPRMRRIRCTGDALRGLDWAPGQHVRVRVEGMTLRTYSVWDYADGEHLDLCVFDQPAGGPGARWSRDVGVGQPVTFTRPQGRMVLREQVSYHVFAGDETACPAFGAMLRALPATTPVHGVVEVADPADRMPLPRAEDLRWIGRTGTDGIIAALRELDLPAQPGAAYVAGEARTCQAIRRHFVSERGWPRTSVVVKPFWAPGKRGLD
ncbi:siderophore-interacting protein [Dactylosporangium sp. AC04546]|uniref:siderophore-interacting protein n=1 Tax=Dactylosporangium sp. AC04546 TaxID=2862460 RepID=UPI001EE0E4D9|nr:siderophore-interacting protein [Dactylosporangium sp. AC04546]WVK81267.1 siderophore-interacting protein [Dactylosporangium sp. AC04546]